MNFFGHAVVASYHSSSLRFALGAMLPDFSSMCRGRLVAIGDAEVSAGIDHHHQIDAAFHGLPAFRELCRAAGTRLRRAGMPRGPARGAAHVAVELLLDGVLIAEAEPASADLYVEAVQHAAADPDALELRWRRPAEGDRWRDLLRRLADRGLPVGYLDLGVVTDRVGTILSRRPLLAMDEAGARILRAEIGSVGAAVAERSLEIMSALR